MDSCEDSSVRVVNIENFKTTFFPALKGHCRWRITRAGNVLDRRMTAESSLSIRKLEIMQFLAPFTALSQRPTFQLCALILGLVLLFNASISFKSLEDDGLSELQDLRIIFDNCTTIIPKEITFLRRGCIQYSVAFANISGLISLPKRLQMDSISLTLAAVGAATPTSEFLFALEGSLDDRKTWTPLASSGSRWVRDGIRLINETTKFRERLQFNRRPPWPWYGMYLVRPVLFGSSCIVQAVMGYCGRLPRAKRMWCFSFVLLAMSTAVVAGGYASAGHYKEVFIPFVESLLFSMLALSVSLWESHFGRTCMFVGLFALLGRIVQDCFVFNDCSYLCIELPIEAGFILGFGLFCEIRKRKFLTTAITVIKESKSKYDANWQRIGLLNESALLTLDDLANRITASCEEGLLISYHSQLMESTHVRENSWNGTRGLPRSLSFDYGADLPLSRQIASLQREGFVGSREAVQPVKSLDQLYSQALFVVVMLHSKCVELASLTGGRLCDQTGHSDGIGNFGTMHDTAEHLQHGIQRGFIKSPSRAIEKALTCYDSDVSRLVDICRARLVFESVGNLCACLELVNQSSEVMQIVQIKNYLSPHHNGQYSAGFRGVILNVCFKTETARMLGVDLHVCELQLLVNGFEPPEQHSRYLEFRLARKFLSVARTVRSLPKSEHRLHAEDQKLRTDSSGSPAILTSTCCQAKMDGVASVDSIQGIFRLPSDPSVEWTKTVKDLVYEVFLRSSIEGGGRLDRMACRFHEALQLSSASSVGFTSRPIVAMASKPVFQILLVFFMANAAYQLSLVSNTLLRSAGSFEASTVRFTMLLPRSGDLDRNPLNISLFGILNDGCIVQGISSPTVVNNTVSVNYLQPIKGNGYFFVTSAGTEESDPVRWTVEASNDNGSTWSMIGASVIQLRRDGLANFYPTLSFPTPLARNHRVSFDARPPWPWAMKWVLTNSGFTVGFCSCLVAILFGRVDQVPAIFAAIMFFAAFAGVTAAFGYHVQGEYRETAAAWLQIPQYLIMAYGTIFSESRIIFVKLIYGLTDFGARLVTDFFIYSFDQRLLLQYTLKSPGTVAGLFGVCVTLFRTLAVWRARNLVKSDQEKYNNVWQSIVRDEESRRNLTELKHLADNITKLCQKAVARQFNHQQAYGPLLSYTSKYREIEARRLSMCGITDSGVTIPGSVDLERPIDSLDQLYVQASCLNPILISKVMGWAMASNGYFPLKGPSEILQYGDAKTVSAKSIRWARIKSPNRAVEKVVRSYGQDVSRLIDVCRQAIVFDSIADMATCLAAMQADKDAVMVRIKNRMDPTYEAATSAGYRDVAINLRIHTAVTEDLGIETHVCEVQLILRPVAEIKSEAGHQRYIAFRNLRAE